MLPGWLPKSERRLPKLREVLPKSGRRLPMLSERMPKLQTLLPRSRMMVSMIGRRPPNSREAVPRMRDLFPKTRDVLPRWASGRSVGCGSRGELAGFVWPYPGYLVPKHSNPGSRLWSLGLFQRATVKLICCAVSHA